jgi:transcriptional regulator
MYPPPKFQPYRATALAFAQAHGFATLCAFEGRRAVSSELPFCLDYSSDGTPSVVFHVARSNPLAALADRQRTMRPHVFAAETAPSSAATRLEGNA